MYQAIVARIQTRPHPNADRLQLGTVVGHQVIVGLDTADGTLGVFFPSDGQLSALMCAANDLIGRINPDTGKHEGGFFAANRRVRAQSFRGAKSDGYWTELSALKWTGADLTILKDGDSFDSLNGQLVCEKYYTPATKRAMSQPQARKKRDLVFPEHVDTKQFRYFKDAIPADAIVYVTEKLHGTSMRYGHVPEKLPNSWWKRLLGHEPTRTDWKHLNGSRHVVLKDDTDPGYYGTNTFRYDVTQNIVLHKGEILYGEIVGDVQAGQPIMTPQPVKDDVKHLRKEYGDTMRYTYGCAEGEHKMFVYRVTRINEDGIEIDLSWPQVVQRCGELGLQTVPLIATCLARSANNNYPWLHFNHESQTWLAASGVSALTTYTDYPSLLDGRHIREGVVFRIESCSGITFLKEKSFAFKVLEGIIKDSDSYVDTEETA
jgi:hypothetical protein